MSITSDLEQILSARYGKDVRQAIHDSIEEGYNIAVQAQGIAETSQESAKAYAQAALASEQAAEDYKTAAEQAAQQAMSGTPEGYADLVAKVNSIYRQTATSFNVVGTSEGSALAHTIYGMSVQDGTPTPSVPVEIQNAKANFRCTGKNLIPYPYSDGTSKTSNGITYTVNDDGSITANGTATGESLFVLRQGGVSLNNTNNIKVHTNKNLVLSGCPSGGSPNNFMVQIALTNGTNMWKNSWEDRGKGKTFSFIPSVGYYNISIIRIVIASGVTANNLTFRPMLTLADADQTYEPYQHTDVTTDITLRAIEVTSSDDYNLERDGKYYIADTVEWSEDRGYEITRRVGSYILTGDEDISLPSANISQYGSSFKFGNYANYLSRIKAVTANTIDLNSNYLRGKNQIDSWHWPIYGSYSTQDNGSGLYRTSGNIWLTFGASDMSLMGLSSTVDSLKTWLTNHSLEIVYPTEPYTEPITSEQAQALLSLKTYDEATSISATGDVEPSLDLEYSKDRNTALGLMSHNLAHINSLKIADLSS